MRTKEFTCKIMHLEFIDTERLQPLDYIILHEQELQNTTLVESLDQSSIQYLQDLTSLGSIPVIGNNYIPILIMLMSEPDNRLAIHGEYTLVTLTKINQENNLTLYIFTRNTGEKITYPLSRLSALSFHQLYLFETMEQYQKFNTALTIKFNADLPKIEFI